VVEPPPWAWGWFDHPSKGQKQKMGFRHLGLAVPPPRALGGFDHPYAQGGDLATLKRPKKKQNKKWVSGFWGWSDHPQGPGWLHPHTSRRGWPKPATPKSPKPIFLGGFFFFFFFLGWPDHPLGNGGGSTTPRPAMGPTTSDFLLFCFLFFNIFLFLKKKNNGQNDVVLGWMGVVVLKPKTVYFWSEE
jgi:hypothetical protein